LVETTRACPRKRLAADTAIRIFFHPVEPGRISGSFIGRPDENNECQYRVPIGSYASRTFPFCIAFGPVRFMQNHFQTSAKLFLPLGPWLRSVGAFSRSRGLRKSVSPWLSLISCTCRILATHRITMNTRIVCIQFLSFSLKNQVGSEFKSFYYHI
jgi:hypothetical protein